MAQNPALPAVIAVQKVPRCAVLADAVPAPTATAATTAAPRAADRRNAATSAGFSVISTIIANNIVFVRRLPGFGEDCPRQLGPRCPVPATSSSSASLEAAGHIARRCGHHRRPGRAGTHPGARRWRWIPGSDLADPQHRLERLTRATALPPTPQAVGTRLLHLTAVIWACALPCSQRKVAAIRARDVGQTGRPALWTLFISRARRRPPAVS